MIGTTIAHYRVTAKLGEGGMGEVYRATDPRLNRDVAIKLLPESLAADPDRLARFKREAQVLASLSHANIGQIYGLEDHDERNAIVLELIEGQTLAEHIVAGPLQPDEAQRIAAQIAEALEAAHEKGIVHRDLKPANIKITPQGVVKVLDFGLAKAVQPDGVESGDIAHSPTLTAAATQAGMIMGTAAYMSPEQARGKPVDRRADVWAFGCVLYEMLTGSAPFPGEDVSSVLAHVITKEPDFDRLPDGLPAQVEDLVRRCLRKDVAMRLSDAGAARIALAEARDAPQADEAETAPVTRPASRRTLVFGVLAGLLVGASGAIGLWNALQPTGVPQPASMTQFDLALEPPPSHRAMALSSDGKTLVYAGKSEGRVQLYVRDLGGFESRPIPGTEGGVIPFFSRDDSTVGFSSAGRLKAVDLRGGMPRSICAIPGIASGIFWTEDDTIVYATNSSKVPFAVSASGGEPRPIVPPEQEGLFIRQPYPLPGGRAILVAIESPRLEGQWIGAVDLDDGSWKAIVRGSSPLLIGSNQLLFAQQGRWMTVALDLETLETLGPERPAPLEKPASGSHQGKDLGFHYASWARSGVLVYEAGTGSMHSEVVRLGPDGAAVPTGIWGSTPRLDAAGSSAAVVEAGRVFVADLDSGTRTQLTFDFTVYPMWSPDGRDVLFSTFVSGNWRMHRVAADGDADSEVIFDGVPHAFATSMRRDGTILGYRVHADSARDIFMIAPDGTVEMVLETRYNERAGAFSPDGAAFAYVSDEDGSDVVYVRQFPDSGRRWRVSPGLGVSPVWSRDGKTLYYVAGDTIFAAPVVRSSTIRIGEPEEVYTSNRLGVDDFGLASFDSLPDGGLVLSLREPSDTRTRVVLNWDPAVATAAD